VSQKMTFAFDAISQSKIQDQDQWGSEWAEYIMCLGLSHVRWEYRRLWFIDNLTGLQFVSPVCLGLYTAYLPLRVKNSNWTWIWKQLRLTFWD